MNSEQFIKICLPQVESSQQTEKFKPKTVYPALDKRKIGFAEYAFSSHVGDRTGHSNDADDNNNDTNQISVPVHTIQQQAAGNHGGVAVISDGGSNGGSASASTAAPAGGDGGASGGAAAAGEAIDLKNFNSILESYETSNPQSDVVGEIKAMFNDELSGGNGKLYHGCDGISCSAKTPMVKPVARPTDQEQIAALSAACEAALNAFKTYTGYDYCEMQH